MIICQKFNCAWELASNNAREAQEKQVDGHSSREAALPGVPTSSSDELLPPSHGFLQHRWPGTQHLLLLHTCYRGKGLCRVARQGWKSGLGRAEREGSWHPDHRHEHAACAKAPRHQPRSSEGACRSSVLFCKCAAASGVSLHRQNSIESSHPDNARNSPSPLAVHQPLAGFNRWQQRPFHLVAFGKSKACSPQEGENLAIKAPAACLLGAQLTCILSKALTPLSLAFSLLRLKSFVSTGFATNHQDLKLQTSLGLAQPQDGMRGKGTSSVTRGKPLPLHGQRCPGRAAAI